MKAQVGNVEIEGTVEEIMDFTARVNAPKAEPEPVVKVRKKPNLSESERERRRERGRALGAMMKARRAAARRA